MDTKKSLVGYFALDFWGSKISNARFLRYDNRNFNRRGSPVASRTDTYKKLQLTADIDLDGAEWIPIMCNFGTFDGGDYIISNFKITETMQSAGFFGYNYAIIKNLKVENFTIIQVDFPMRVGHYAGGIAGFNGGNIADCFAFGDISAEDGHDINTGGLIGSNSGTIAFSNAIVTV